MLLFHGVPEEKNEDLMQLVTSVIKKQIKLSDFESNDIKHCHRMGRPSVPHKHRPILVKLQHISIRDKVWFEKSKLKGTGITVSEFLTKTRHDIFMAAREKLGVTKCWTLQGAVYVLGTNNKRRRIHTLADIQATGAEQQSKPGLLATKSDAPKSRRAAAAKK